MKALPMPSGQNEGTANLPYQILLVSFHLQYRNVKCSKLFLGYFKTLETQDVLISYFNFKDKIKKKKLEIV